MYGIEHTYSLSIQFCTSKLENALIHFSEKQLQILDGKQDCCIVCIAFLPPVRASAVYFIVYKKQSRECTKLIVVCILGSFLDMLGSLI